MKANELRIGNYVLDDEGLMAKINGFKPFGHSVRCDEEEGCWILIDLYRKDGSIGLGYGLESFECKPIPITEEWLLRFGFEKYDWTNAYFIKTIFGYLMIQFYKTEIDLFFTQMGADSKGMKMFGRRYVGNANSTQNIKHVHQLQNLYFALTGQELTIKEATK